MGFPGGSEGKASACSVQDPGSIPGLGRSPREGNGNSLQYSCLENSMDGGAWQATVCGVAQSRTRLSDFTFTFVLCFPGSTAVKEFTCNAGDLSLIPRLGRSLEKGTATSSSILAWRIPGLYSPWGRKELDKTE